MTTQVNKSLGALLIAGLLAVPNLLQGQPTAHYAPGLEGIKAATLPPPGFWLRDYNWFYYAEQENNSQGNKLADQKAFAYVNAPRLLWITDQQLLNGYLGVDALVEMKYTYLKGLDQTFGLGDTFFEGTWSWHLKQWDMALAAGGWAPTGDSPVKHATYAGSGFWGEMLTAGATWYPDDEKKWALSVLNRYEFNQQQQYSEITPGEVYTVEGGLSYGLTKTLDVGAVGYYQQKVTTDSGPGTSDVRDRVAGIGPEVSVFFPSVMLGVSLRYEYEFLAESRLQGHTATLTLTKKF